MAEERPGSLLSCRWPSWRVWRTLTGTGGPSLRYEDYTHTHTQACMHARCCSSCWCRS